MSDSQHNEAKFLPRISDFAPHTNNSWLQRTFSPLSPGGVRGNILLLTITTMGSSFFYLPYLAKDIGFIAVIMLLLCSATISALSSKVLYLGFKYTGATTYDECFNILLGPKLGLFSNIFIFVHILLGVIGTWIFSFTFILSGLQQIFGFDDNSQSSSLVLYGYFLITFLTLYIVTLYRSVDKLKTISLMGIFFILYLVICFLFKTPEYYGYYKEVGPVTFHAVIWKLEMFKVYGIIQALFLNQYTILPICHNVVYTNHLRISKIIQRSIILLFTIYLILLTCGYLSEPDSTQTKLFILRKKIPGDSDRSVLFGKLGFGIALFIAILVKSCYLLLYFDQLVLKFTNPDSAQEDPIIESSESIDVNKLDSPPLEEGLNNIASPKEKPVIEHPGILKLPKIIYLKNLVIFGSILLLVILLMDRLSTIISLLGGFVGAFEIIIFPGEFIRHYFL
jgi:hypothetical protein